MGVVGEFNKNLKELEKITQSNLYSRGNSILIKSTPEKNEIVKDAIQFLANQFINNGNIENKDILSSIDKFMINEKVKNQNVTDIIKTPKKSIIPRSEKQKEYVRALRQSDIVISAGPAGTGKTFLAVAVGLTMLLEKKIERIILSRPAVEAGERLGFLPGDMKEKVDPYLRPLYDSLYDLFDFEKIQRMIEIGEGVGVYYLGDNQKLMLEELASAKTEVEAGADPFEVASRLASKGAANALDCAAWDLRCKLEGNSIWELVGLNPNSLHTVATIGIGTDQFMAQRALDFHDCHNLKIKLDSERPLERVRAIRDARPDAVLVIDANQAWTRELLEELIPELARLGVKMVEQPLKRGHDEELAGLKSEIRSCLFIITTGRQQYNQN